MKRFTDIILSLILIVITIVPYIFICIIIIISDGMPFLYYSKRIGKNNKIFFMPKFRTMKKNTPQVATHLLNNANKHLILFGGFLRKYSLDELPQLLSVIKGDMSLVGPRPALFNQKDLIKLREKFEIYKVRPGITGYAQINGRDNLSIEKKVKLDYYYVDNYSYSLDIIILIKTFFAIFRNKDVHH